MHAPKGHAWTSKYLNCFFLLKSDICIIHNTIFFSVASLFKNGNLKTKSKSENNTKMDEKCPGSSVI